MLLPRLRRWAAVAVALACKLRMLVNISAGGSTDDICRILSAANMYAGRSHTPKAH
jgi:hypothetical protein